MSFIPTKRLEVSSLEEALAKLQVIDFDIIIPDNLNVFVNNSDDGNFWSIGPYSFKLGNNSGIEPINPHTDAIVGDGPLIKLENTSGYVGKLQLRPAGTGVHIYCDGSSLITDGTSFVGGGSPVSMNNAIYVGLFNSVFFATQGSVVNSGNSIMLDINNLRTTDNPSYIETPISIQNGTLQTLLINNFNAVVEQGVGKSFISLANDSIVNSIVINTGRYDGDPDEFITGAGTNPQLKFKIFDVDGVNVTPSSVLPARNITENYNVDPATDDFIICDGSFNVFLPPVSGLSGYNCSIKNIGLGTVIIKPDGNELIEDHTEVLLIKQRSYRIVCDGTAWWII